MSSDGEDYDGDTNWDEIATLRNSISPRRPIVQGPTSSRTNHPTNLQASRPPPRSRGPFNSLGVPYPEGNIIYTPLVVPRASTSQRLPGPSSEAKNTSRVQSIISALSSQSYENNKKPRDSDSNTLGKGKRKRSRDNIEARKNKYPHPQDSSPARKIQKVLNGYDDELSCPICLDYFLVPQLLNPCGHTVCGDCLDHWLTKRANRQCPVCRANLSYPSTHLPNYAIRNTVDKYIELKRSNNDADWLEGGTKWKERGARKRAYDVVEQMKKTEANKRVLSTREYDLYFGPHGEQVRVPIYLDYTGRSADSPTPPPPPPLPGHRRILVVPPRPREIIQISSGDEGSGSDNEEEEEERPVNVLPRYQQNHPRPGVR